jgi:hypothetical protein
MCMIAAQLFAGVFASSVSFPTGLEGEFLLNDEMAPERPTCVPPPLFQAGPILLSIPSRLCVHDAGGPISTHVRACCGR